MKPTWTQTNQVLLGLGPKKLEPTLSMTPTKYGYTCSLRFGCNISQFGYGPGIELGLELLAHLLNPKGSYPVRIKLIIHQWQM